MKPWRQFGAVWLWWAGLLLPLWAHAFTVTDDRGVVLSFDQAPQRVVSLLPSLTETVCALNRCHRLVGVDRYSNYPSQVQQLPHLGGGLDPNVEAIVALRPDVVLMAKSSRAGARLQSLGLKVMALESQNKTDVQRILLKIGQLLEVPDASKVWLTLDAEVSAAAESVPASARGLKVYFEVGAGPYAAGEASFIGETLARLGVKNIVSADLGPFPKLNPEWVVRANPDLIMVEQGGVEGLLQRPGWSSLHALRERRVCTFTNEQIDVLSRPGPRLPEAARILAHCLTSLAPVVKGAAE